MGLINLLLKAIILLLDLRDTYDALDSVKSEELGRSERTVLVRNVQDGSKQTTTRRRVGTSKRKAAVKSALTTVLVWNLFHKVEPVCDRTIAWFVPFYDSFKTLFLIWMLFTRSYGAGILVYRFIAPMVRPYEPLIDGVIGLTLAFFAWIALLLSPITNRCAELVQSFGSATPISTQPAAHITTATRSSDSTSSRFASASVSKKKPPSSPPAAVKSSPPSLPARATATFVSQPRLGTVQERQMPLKTTSQTSLAATRRVLQELPVPRHPFIPNAAETTAPLASSASSATAGVVPGTPPSSTLLNGSTTSTSVKVEPASPV